MEEIRQNMTKQNVLRVMKIVKKPSKEEYRSALLVSGAGIAVIGLVGFVTFMIKQLVI